LTKIIFKKNIKAKKNKKTKEEEEEEDNLGKQRKTNM
jgi:hypothetical protein